MNQNYEKKLLKTLYISLDNALNINNELKILFFNYKQLLYFKIKEQTNWHFFKENYE